MTNKSGIIVRSVGVIAATAILATGVTWAALSSSPVTLDDTNLTTGTASLKIWDGSTFTASAPGFQINNLIPGTDSDAQRFYFQNDGDISLNLTARVIGSPGSTGITSWGGVKVIFTEEESGLTQEYTISELIAGPVDLPGDGVEAGVQGDSNSTNADGNYNVRFNIESDNVTGSSASITDLDIQFDGAQQ